MQKPKPYSSGKKTPHKGMKKMDPDNKKGPPKNPPARKK